MLLYSNTTLPTRRFRQTVKLWELISIVEISTTDFSGFLRLNCVLSFLNI